MIKIEEIRRKRIIEEAEYFGKFDCIYSENEWRQYLDYLKKPGRLENLIEAMNSFYLLKLEAQYLYSHIDNNGNFVTLKDCAKFDEYVKNNYSYFKRIERDYIYILIDMNVPLFFIDVDNTLTDQGFLSQEKIDYIKNFKYKDHIILSTGKVSDAIMNVIEACGLENNYYCCINGSVICKNGEYELVNKLGSVSENLINELKKTNLMFIGYYENGIKKIVEPDEVCNNAFAKYNERFLDDDNPIDYNRIVKILCFIMDDGSELERNKEKMVQDIVSPYEELTCVRTAYHCYEILRKDQHKGNGVKRVAEKMNMYYRCSVGVGDSMNDYAMLTHTGRSYIVSTSSDELMSHGFVVLGEDRNTDIIELLKSFENREMV